MTAQDLFALLPILILTGTAGLLLIFEVFSIGAERSWAATFAVIGYVVALYFVLGSISEPPRSLFAGGVREACLVRDPFSSLSSAVIILGALVASLLSPAYIKNAKCAHAEYYALMMFAVVGMIVMVMASDLITLFLGIELMSISVYALTGFRSTDLRASEAALKYFLMGAFATGFLLMGIALIYGSVPNGSVAYPDLARALKTPMADEPIFVLGLVLLLIGLAFKLAAVPFHWWAPDVYEGAPTPITGFMAVGVKAAAFLGLLRLVVVALGVAESDLLPSLLTGLAYLTIICGNVLAVVQRNMKRMLAYSSISHAGYAMIGIVAAAQGEASAGSALMFYLTAYTFMTLGAFGVLTYLERAEGGAEAERFGAYAGVGFKHPAAALAMVVFMVSLAGMPPTGGFFGKLYIFSAALRAGELGLVIVGVLGSVISVYYYLGVIVAFYMRDVPDPGPLPSATRSRHLALGLAIAVIAVIALGVFPSRVIELSKAAVMSLRVG